MQWDDPQQDEPMTMHGQGHGDDLVTQVTEWERMPDGSFEAVFPAATLYCDPKNHYKVELAVHHTDKGPALDPETATLTVGVELVRFMRPPSINTLKLTEVPDLRLGNPFMQAARLRFKPPVSNNGAPPSIKNYRALSSSKGEPLSMKDHRAERTTANWELIGGRLRLFAGPLKFLYGEDKKVHIVGGNDQQRTAPPVYVRCVPRTGHLVRIGAAGTSVGPVHAGDSMEIIRILEVRQSAFYTESRFVQRYVPFDPAKHAGPLPSFPELDTTDGAAPIRLLAVFPEGHRAYASHCPASGRFKATVSLAPWPCGSPKRYDGAVCFDYTAPTQWAFLTNQSEAEGQGLNRYTHAPPESIAVLAYPALNQPRPGTSPLAACPYQTQPAASTQVCPTPTQTSTPASVDGTAVAHAVSGALRVIADMVDKLFQPQPAPSVSCSPRRAAPTEAQPLPASRDIDGDGDDVQSVPRLRDPNYRLKFQPFPISYKQSEPIDCGFTFGSLPMSRTPETVDYASRFLPREPVDSACGSMSTADIRNLGDGTFGLKRRRQNERHDGAGLGVAPAYPFLQ